MKSRPDYSPLLAAALLVFSLQGLALDQSQPINISSDRASYAANRGVYQGNVIMQQGPLRIEADEVTVIESDRTVQRVIATGNPARFRQEPGDGQEEITAHAKTIEYLLDTEQIILLGDASVHQLDSEIRGQRITFDNRQQSVRAEGSAGEGEGRVDMVLQPRVITTQDNGTDNGRTESQ